MISLEPVGNLPLGGFVVALDLGLLIGAERERSKGSGPGRAAAGVRTFALVALLGATAAVLESIALTALFGAGIVLLAATSYRWYSASHRGLRRLIPCTRSLQRLPRSCGQRRQQMPLLPAGGGTI